MAKRAEAVARDTVSLADTTEDPALQCRDYKGRRQVAKATSGKHCTSACRLCLCEGCNHEC